MKAELNSNCQIVCGDSREVLKTFTGQWI